MNVPIWMYWEGEYPNWIKECHDTVFAHGEDVRLVAPSLFDQLRDCDRDIDLSPLCIAHRADFIRAFLLAKFGGIWLDSDCIVLKPLIEASKVLNEFDFFAFTQRQGNISNSFLGARPGSVIANNFYKRICHILRSGQHIEWLTIGSEALEASIKETKVPWHEFDVEMIQPICWSQPKMFFKKRALHEHERVFNTSSLCYMLSGSMISGLLREDTSLNLSDEDTFFHFLIQKSNQNILNSILDRMEYRKNTDDDIWVLPEIITHNMYQIKKTTPSIPGYIIDCSAHIGAFSVMCSYFFEDAKIVSFEPNPESFQFLKKNVGAFENIFPFEKAVDIKDGTLQLYAPGQKEWTGRWTSIPNTQKSIEVESIDFFSFITSLNSPVLILKMDIEGYEEIIFANAQRDFFDKIDTIILETHTDQFDHRWLTENGFQLLFQPHISQHRQFVYTKTNK